MESTDWLKSIQTTLNKFLPYRNDDIAKLIFSYLSFSKYYRFNFSGYLVEVHEFESNFLLEVSIGTYKICRYTYTSKHWLSCGVADTLMNNPLLMLKEQPIGNIPIWNYYVGGMAVNQLNVRKKNFLDHMNSNTITPEDRYFISTFLREEQHIAFSCPYPEPVEGELWGHSHSKVIEGYQSYEGFYSHLIAISSPQVKSAGGYIYHRIHKGYSQLREYINGKYNIIKI